MPRNETERVLESIIKQLNRLRKLEQKRAEARLERKLVAEFEENVKLADEMGRDLNDNLGIPVKEERRHHGPVTEGAEVFFAGCLQTDQSERVMLSNPIAFQGGWLLRTPEGNILVDPGNGTLRALAEGRYSVEHVDVVLVSHAHPSATNELDALFNSLAGYTPGRSLKEQAHNKVWLLATECVINGRGGYPSVLKKPLHLHAIKGSPIVASVGSRWRMRRARNGKVLVEALDRDAEDGDGIIITALAARHKEAPCEGDASNNLMLRDERGEAGEAVSCFHFANARDRWTLLYTGDTEYDPEVMSWMRDKRYQRPSVLIANTRTLAYLPRHRDMVRMGGKGASLHVDLHPTKNQLGWAGTYELSTALRPGTLVMRGFNLECVIRKIESQYVYAPERLAVYQRTMELLLREGGLRRTQVYIPGRLVLGIDSGGKASKQEEVPAFFPYETRRVGNSYVTANQRLIAQIDLHIQRLQEARDLNETVYEDVGPLMRRAYKMQFTDAGKSKPISEQDRKALHELGEEIRRKASGGRRGFLVIEGGIGAGKSLLATSMGREILESVDAAENAVNETDLGSISDTSGLSEIFGVLPGTFTQVPGKEGFLDHPGVLVCNQLEKLPDHLTRAWVDVVETGCFRPLGSTGPEHLRVVRPVIIFTTNVPLVSSGNLAGDLVNRLLGNALRIPDLDELQPEERERELSLVVLKLCEDSRVTLDPDAYEFLVREIEWREAKTLRTLRNVLAKAKDLTLLSYPGALAATMRARGGGADAVNCHLTKLTVKEALEAVVAGRPREKERHAAAMEPLTEKLFWGTVTFLCEGTLGRTYTHLRGQQGRVHDKNVKRPGLTSWLEPLLRYLPFESGKSDEAFYQGLADILKLEERRERLDAAEPDLLNYCAGLESDGLVAFGSHEASRDSWLAFLRQEFFREVDSSDREVDDDVFNERLRALGASLRALSPEELKHRCATLRTYFFSEA